MNSKEIKNLLYNKYSPPQFAFFSEVANGTGGHAERRADGVAVNLWPSQGFAITGFEIKVSRSDFLNEIKKPWKAESVMSFCHQWYLVVPKGLVKKEELPINWGLIEEKNGKLYTTKIAPHLKPKMVTRSFVAALLRRATENTIPTDTFHTMLDEYKKKADVAIEEKMIGRAERSVRDLENLKKRVVEFEKASGIKIHEVWQRGEEIGEAVKFVLDGNLESFNRRVNCSMEDLEKIMNGLKTFQELFKKL